MQRPQLVEITGNRVYNTELTPYQRGMIMGGQLLGHSSGKMKKAFNFLKIIIQYIIEKHGERNNDESKSRSEKLNKFFARDKRLFIKLARKNPRLIYAQLLKKGEVICNYFTVYRIFKKYDLINWMAKKRSFLTKKLIKKKYL